MKLKRLLQDIWRLIRSSKHGYIIIRTDEKKNLRVSHTTEDKETFVMIDKICASMERSEKYRLPDHVIEQIIAPHGVSNDK